MLEHILQKKHALLKFTNNVTFCLDKNRIFRNIYHNKHSLI